MGRTRSNHQNQIQAAALPLETGKVNSLLFNEQVINYLTNGADSGADKLAWSYWFKIPELHYASRYISNSLSMARLYVGKTNSSGADPQRLPDDHVAVDLLENFAGGFNGQSELLDRLGIHLTVTGDSVLIGPKTDTGGLEPPFDQWRVYAREEVSSRNGKIFLRAPANYREIALPDSVVAVRIWRPNPVSYWDSESPVKAAFTVLKELDLLDQHVRASAISRLAGAGLLLIPDEIDLPSGDMEIEGTEIDRFVALLTEVMGLAIKNRESAAALVPIMLRGPADYIDKINHLTFSTPFAETVPELRTGAIRRLALGMDIPPEVLLGAGDSSGWCVDPLTEIFTTEGWRTYDQIIPGVTQVRTLNHETGLAEWQTLFDVAVFNVKNEKMLSIEGNTHSSLTTMNHRWPVRSTFGRKRELRRKWKTSETLSSSDCIYTGAFSSDLPVEPKYSDAFVELMAWAYTEGCIKRLGGAGNGGRLQGFSISQSHIKNPENVLRIRRVLDEFCPGQYSEAIRTSRDRDPVTVFHIFVEPAKAIIDEMDEQKVINYNFILSLTQSQLDLFINISLLADRCSGGTLSPGTVGTCAFGQKNPERVGVFEFAAQLAGHSTNRWAGAERIKEFNGYAYSTVTYGCTVHKRSLFSPKDKHKTIVDYSGVIWCPVTPNGTWLARRNGHVFYTGNSQWQVESSTVRVHTAPLLQLITSSLTVGWLRPALESLPLSDRQREEISSLAVYFDLSNLEVRQDITGDAQALFDRLEIDADALRLATGYGPNAVPDNEELAKQILFQLVRGGDPGLIAYAIDGLRNNFGIKLLPPAPEIGAECPSPGAPNSPTPPAENSEIRGIVPGKRSQDKQTSPPPVPDIRDPNNNEPGV